MNFVKLIDAHIRVFTSYLLVHLFHHSFYSKVPQQEFANGPELQYLYSCQLCSTKHKNTWGNTGALVTKILFPLFYSKGKNEKPKQSGLCPLLNIRRNFAGILSLLILLIYFCLDAFKGCASAAKIQESQEKVRKSFFPLRKCLTNFHRVPGIIS